MRLQLVVFALILTGCAQLLKGQEQPVITKKDGVYYTTCSGVVESFGTCNNKALVTCPKGYSVVEKFQDANGVIRSLTFKCN